MPTRKTIDPVLARRFQEVFGRTFWREARLIHNPPAHLAKRCRGCRQFFAGHYLGPIETHCPECQ